MSQTRAVPSWRLTVTTYDSLGSTAAATTSPECPRSSVTNSPFSARYTRAVLSGLVVTTNVPRGLTATSRTGSVCPFKDISSFVKVSEASSYSYTSTIPSVGPLLRAR